MVGLLDLIKKRLPHTTAGQRAAFISAVEDAGTTFDDDAPLYLSERKLRDQLLELDRLGQKLAPVLSKLDSWALDVIEADAFAVAWRRTNTAEVAADASTKFRGRVASMGRTLSELAASARRLRRQRRQQLRGVAEDRLLVAIAEAYGSAFGTRATPWRDGAFSAFAQSIFASRQLPLPSEARLRRLLARSDLSGKRRGPGRPRDNGNTPRGRTE